MSPFLQSGNQNIPSVCGTYEANWSFIVDVRNHWQEGEIIYIVQKVTVWLKCDNCPKAGSTSGVCGRTKGQEPTKPQFNQKATQLEYYEAWELPVSEPPQVEAPDRGVNTIEWKNCCGSGGQRGEIRAFLSSRGDEIYRDIQSWKQRAEKPIGRVRCGDQGTDIGAGSLPWYHKPGEPPKWGDRGTTSASREVSVKWNCCCGNEADRKAGLENRSKAWANP